MNDFSENGGTPESPYCTYSTTIMTKSEFDKWGEQGQFGVVSINYMGNNASGEPQLLIIQRRIVSWRRIPDMSRRFNP